MTPATPAYSCILAILLSFFIAAHASAADPSPEELLRGALDRLGGLSSLEVSADVSIQIKMMGHDQSLDSRSNIKFQKPKKFVLVSEGEPTSLTYICDGQQIVRYIPMLNKYTVKEAGADGASDSLMGLVDLPSMIQAFDAEELYAAIANAITESKYLGKDAVGEFACDRCRYETNNATIDIWFDAGEMPLMRKVTTDISKSLARQAEDAAALKGASMNYVITFRDWKLDPKLADADFEFVPPEGARKVESHSGGTPDQSEPDVHPLVGQPAPPFESADLQDAKFVLSDRLGKDVVMLDFWATWCGPCVAALPEINEVATSFADRGVVFYAVNIGEDKLTVSEFLETQRIDVPVLMDEKGTVAGAYQASAIPQTVLIGKDGRVQVVHVGFGGNMKELLTEELEKLLAGEDLAKDVLAKAEAEKARRAEQMAAALNSPELKLAWTHPGDWSGVATDSISQTAYAVTPSGKVASLNARGEVVRELEIDVAGTTLRLAELVSDEQPELLTFSAWQTDLVATGADGKELWTYPQGDGIDDVWVADLDRDGQDELIVGFNGGTGLHVVNADGNPKWTNTSLGNVWHVAAGDMDGNGSSEVVTTSAQGVVHVFAADGKKLKDISVPLYANMIRTANLDGDDKPATAIVAGSGNDVEMLVAVDLDGAVRWNIPLPSGATAHVDSLGVAQSRPWAAVAMRDGIVHIVDLTKGQIIAHSKEQGRRPEVAWQERENDTPLILVATGGAVNAFEVQPAATE